jgi:hypothetical protein
LQRREASCGRAEEASKERREGLPERGHAPSRRIISQVSSPLSLASLISSPGSSVLDRAGFSPLLAVSSGYPAGFLVDLVYFLVLESVSGPFGAVICACILG